MKKRLSILVLALMIMTMPFMLCSCDGPQPKGEYESKEPYLYIDIIDAETIIDFSGKMNLNGEDVDIVFSINKDSRHFEIKQDNNVLFEGYYKTEEDGAVLLLDTNEAHFTLERKE